MCVCVRDRVRVRKRDVETLTVKDGRRVLRDHGNEWLIDGVSKEIGWMNIYVPANMSS